MIILLCGCIFLRVEALVLFKGIIVGGEGLAVDAFAAVGAAYLIEQYTERYAVEQDVVDIEEQRDAGGRLDDIEAEKDIAVEIEGSDQRIGIEPSSSDSNTVTLTSQSRIYL